MNPSTPDTSAETLSKYVESDNGCTVPDAGHAIDVNGTSARRAPRVGLRGGRHREHTLAAKLAARTIVQPSGCWEVQGHPAHKSNHMYLSVGSPAKPPYVRVYAHRFAWEQANGRPVPPGLVVMHACDNPRCVNPAHLSVGTQRENMQDAARKGRLGRKTVRTETAANARREIGA